MLSKVDNFGTNRKRICDFLLVRHCNYMHRFWDTATYWLKIGYFSYTSLIRGPHSLCSLWNFAVKLTMRKQTRVMGLSGGEDRMIVAWVILSWYRTVSLWQTDRWTDRQTYWGIFVVELTSYIVSDHWTIYEYFIVWSAAGNRNRMPQIRRPSSSVECGQHWSVWGQTNVDVLPTSFAGTRLQTHPAAV